MKKLISILFLVSLITSFVMAEDIETSVDENTDNKEYDKGQLSIMVGYVPGLFFDFSSDDLLTTFSNGFNITMQTVAENKKVGFTSHLAFHFPVKYYLNGLNTISGNKDDLGIISHFKLTALMGPLLKINTPDFLNLSISPGLSYNMDSMEMKYMKVFAINLGLGGIVHCSLFATKPFNLTIGANINYNFFEYSTTNIQNQIKDNITLMGAFQFQPFIGVTYRFNYNFPKLF